MRTSIVALLICSMLFPHLVYANAAAAKKVLDRKNEIAIDAMQPSLIIPMGNDGFIVVGEYFRQGPEFRLCAPSDPGLEGVKFTANERTQRCEEYQNSTFSGRKFVGVSESYSPQEYLDASFGKGMTLLTGVGAMIRRSGSVDLVLYYKIVGKSN